MSDYSSNSSYGSSYGMSNSSNLGALNNFASKDSADYQKWEQATQGGDEKSADEALESAEQSGALSSTDTDNLENLTDKFETIAKQVKNGDVSQQEAAQNEKQLLNANANSKETNSYINTKAGSGDATDYQAVVAAAKQGDMTGMSSAVDKLVSNGTLSQGEGMQMKSEMQQLSSISSTATTPGQAQQMQKSVLGQSVNYGTANGLTGSSTTTPASSSSSSSGSSALDSDIAKYKQDVAATGTSKETLAADADQEMKDYNAASPADQKKYSGANTDIANAETALGVGSSQSGYTAFDKTVGANGVGGYDAGSTLAALTKDAPSTAETQSSSSSSPLDKDIAKYTQDVAATGTSKETLAADADQEMKDYNAASPEDQKKYSGANTDIANAETSLGVGSSQSGYTAFGKTVGADGSGGYDAGGTLAALTKDTPAATTSSSSQTTAPAAGALTAQNSADQKLVNDISKLVTDMQSGNASAVKQDASTVQSEASARGASSIALDAQFYGQQATSNPSSLSSEASTANQQFINADESSGINFKSSGADT